MPEAELVKPAERIVKVKLTQAGFDPAWGKMRQGGVYEFPQEQAVRYVRKGVAKPAPASAKTAREEDRETRMLDLQMRQSAAATDQEMAAAWAVDVNEIQPEEWEDEAVTATTVAVKRGPGRPRKEPEISESAETPVFDAAISR